LAPAAGAAVPALCANAGALASIAAMATIVILRMVDALVALRGRRV
jgi:hypothetical protein